MHYYFFYLGVISTAILGLIILMTILSFFLSGQAKLGKPMTRVRMPRLTLFCILIFRPILKRIYRMLGRDHLIIDATGVIAHNQLYTSHFREAAKKDCTILLPQCLRHSKCPARLDHQKGIDCEMCGLCAVAKIKALRKDITVIVVPGGTFGKRMLEENKPASVIGVACPYELFDGLLLTKALKIPSVGVLLDRYGCVETKVSVAPIAEFLGVDMKN